MDEIGNEDKDLIEAKRICDAYLFYTVAPSRAGRIDKTKEEYTQAVEAQLRSIKIDGIEATSVKAGESSGGYSYTIDERVINLYGMKINGMAKYLLDSLKHACGAGGAVL